MTEIEEWAKKNMFISIFTVIHNNRIEWSAGIRVGMDNKNTWLPSKDEGCQFSSFLTPESALRHAVEFCENYKPKVTRVVVSKKKK